MNENPSPAREVIDLTQNDDDDDSAFTASTIVLNPPECVLVIDDPNFLINSNERNPFRSIIRVNAMPPGIISGMLRNKGNYFIRVWPVFDNLIRRSYHYAKTGRDDAGFAYHILKMIIQYHIYENRNDYDSDAHIRKSFTETLLMMGRFPRDIGAVIVRQWRLPHFSDNISWWQMVIGVK